MDLLGEEMLKRQGIDAHEIMHLTEQVEVIPILIEDRDSHELRLSGLENKPYKAVGLRVDRNGRLWYRDKDMVQHIARRSSNKHYYYVDDDNVSHWCY